MRVRCTEGLANHSDPESCATAREGRGEALTGECIGQPLSRENPVTRVPTRFSTWKAKRSGTPSQVPVSIRRGRRTWHVRTLLAWEPGDLGFGRRRIAGPCREGEEP